MNIKTVLGSIAMAAAVAANAWAISPGDTAPTFDLPGIDQSSVNLENLRGKVVILDFWGSWCGPCKESFPVFSQLNRELTAKGVVMVAINNDTNIDKARKFLEQVGGVSFQVIADPKHTMAKEYGVKVMPTTLVIDQAGVVRFVHEGYHEGEDDVLRQGSLLGQ